MLFIGTSMGGFAALAYAALVPGAAVLAFSPQSTLSKKIVRFERRYHYAQRKWDWETPAFLDAAESLAPNAEVWLAYDPFVAEDRAHARRIQGPGVRHLRLPHMGHRAIRQVKACGALDAMILTIAQGNFDALGFGKALRNRRADPLWQKEFFAEIERRGHSRLGHGAARVLAGQFPQERWVRRALNRFRTQAKLNDGSHPAPTDEVILVAEGAPQAPFTGEIQRLGRALVLPERDGDQRLAAGVLKADGSYAELSRSWIRARKSTPVPVLGRDEIITYLPGRHVFAGHFRGHFGHFLVESTARLWALDHLGFKPDSVLYLPYRGEHEATLRAIEMQRRFLT